MEDIIMNNEITEVAFILDRSGSMHNLEEDTIGGYNSFLQKQKKEKGTCLISTTLFSSMSEEIISHQEISAVREMTKDDYQATGCTALLDALGDSITKMDSYLEEKGVKRNIIYVIITDGKENSSRRYDSKTIRKMISQRQDEGWQFIFLASNINAEEEASGIGIRKENSVNYCNDKEGIAKNFDGISKAVMMMRECSCFSADWREDIDKDFQSRK